MWVWRKVGVQGTREAGEWEDKGECSWFMVPRCLLFTKPPAERQEPRTSETSDRPKPPCHAFLACHSRAPMLRNLSIIRKGLLVILLPILCQTAKLALLFHRQAEMQQAQRRALHSKDVLGHIDHLVSMILQTRSGLFGYAITGNELYVADERKASAAMGPMMDRLRDLVKDDPDQSRRVVAIREAAQRRIEWNMRMDQSLREGHVEQM